MKNFLIALKKYIFTPILALCVFLLISFSIVNLLTTPSNNRMWNDDQKVLPFSTLHGDFVTVHNIRNFTYASTTSYTQNYYDKTFNLLEIKRAWFVVEPFDGVPGSAHTFLSFEFDNDQFLSVSIEIRKEKGESFDPLRAFYNRYELVYVIADEKDVIKLRSNYRKDSVYLYPVKGEKEAFKELLLDMLTRANTLKEKPEFYNTLTNNCTSNIVRHVNKVSPKSIPFFTLQSVFPKYSDKLAYTLDLIDTSLPFEEIRSHYLINEKAMKYANDENFSRRIRE